MLLLTFFEFIHHDKMEGALIALLFLFLLPSLPGPTLGTAPRSLTHTQLSLGRTHTHTKKVKQNYKDMLTKAKKPKARISVIRYDTQHWV